MKSSASEPGLTLQLRRAMAKAQAPVHIANVQVSSVTFRAGSLSPLLTP